MDLFCPNCGTLLNVITDVKKFLFKCPNCESLIEPNPENYLRYEDDKGTDLSKFRLILLTAADDPVNPKVEKICPKCSHNLARQVRLGEEKKLINACIKCKFRWVEGTENDISEVP